MQVETREISVVQSAIEEELNSIAKNKSSRAGESFARRLTQKNSGAAGSLDVARE